MEILQEESNIGLYRDNNEDCTYVGCHPKDNRIKLLAIADGMGGRNYGEVASNETIKMVTNWFNETDIQNIYQIKLLENLLINEIDYIDTTIIKKYGENILGTTLTVAIVGLEKTLIVSIGDSRAYIYKMKELLQITEDDSCIWDLYKNNDIEKDDLRFFPINNYITSCIGLSKNYCNMNTYVINNDYDMLFLFTDGVTDILSDKDIKKTIQNTPPNQLLSKLISKAVKEPIKEKIPLYLKTKFKGKFTIPRNGRDNASGILFKKN